MSHRALFIFSSPNGFDFLYFCVLFLLCITNNTSLNVLEYICIGGRISLGHIFRSGIARSQVIYIYNFTRYCQIALQNSCANLYSHQQCSSVLMSPLPCQRLALSELRNFDEVKEHLVVISILLIKLRQSNFSFLLSLWFHLL